ncbi:hypothetical protein FQZ97_937950 [compost metagenome]
MLGCVAGHDPNIDGDGDHVANHRDDARHHGRSKELGDVLLGQDGVDHQRHRGRNQDAQGAASSQRASGQAARVTVAFHLGQCHRGDGGRRGHRRAADGAEARAGQHRCHGQPAFEPGRDHAGELEQCSGDAALRGEVAHQDEQRNHRQVVTGEAREGRAVEVVEERLPADLKDVPETARAKHRDRDRHANRHQDQHGGEDHPRQ